MAADVPPIQRPSKKINAPFLPSSGPSAPGTVDSLASRKRSRDEPLPSGDATWQEAGRLQEPSALPDSPTTSAAQEPAAPLETRNFLEPFSPLDQEIHSPRDYEQHVVLTSSRQAIATSAAADDPGDSPREQSQSQLGSSVCRVLTSDVLTHGDPKGSRDHCHAAASAPDLNVPPSDGHSGQGSGSLQGEELVNVLLKQVSAVQALLSLCSPSSETPKRQQMGAYVGLTSMVSQLAESLSSYHNYLKAHPPDQQVHAAVEVYKQEAAGLRVKNEELRALLAHREAQIEALQEGLGAMMHGLCRLQDVSRVGDV